MMERGDGVIFQPVPCVLRGEAFVLRMLNKLIDKEFSVVQTRRVQEHAVFIGD